jgi:Predicted dehydrogenases and related proteins
VHGGAYPADDEAVPVLGDVLGGWESVVGRSLRVGARTPAHDVGIIHDLLIHDAALATTLFGALEVVSVVEAGDRASVKVRGAGCDLVMDAMYSPTGIASRHTVFSRAGEIGWLEYDEIGGTVTHDGKVLWTRERDPLGIELTRWRDGGALPLSFGVELVELMDETGAVRA